MQQQQQQQQLRPPTVVSLSGQPGNVQYVIAAAPNDYQHFPKKAAVGAGITLIVAGSLSIIFNIVELAVGETEANKNPYYYLSWLFGYIGHGFWVGILCIIPGGIGIGAGIHKTRNWICGFNTMCIIAACFSIAQFGIGLAGAIAGPDCSFYYSGNFIIDCDEIKNTGIAMEALLAVLAVVEAIAAIYGSTLCCRTYCCCSCCETYTQSSIMPHGTPVTVFSGNQQISTVHYPVTNQGYGNVAYQPGYPGQPVQFTLLPPAYSVQGQYVPSEQPPTYLGSTMQNAQMNSTAIVNVPTYSLQVGHFQTAATVQQQQQHHVIQSQHEQQLYENAPKVN